MEWYLDTVAWNCCIGWSRHSLPWASGLVPLHNQRSFVLVPCVAEPSSTILVADAAFAGTIVVVAVIVVAAAVAPDTCSSPTTVLIAGLMEMSLPKTMARKYPPAWMGDTWVGSQSWVVVASDIVAVVVGFVVVAAAAAAVAAAALHWLAPRQHPC